MTSRDQKGQTRDPNAQKSPISRKWLEIETPFQSTTNRKWPMGYRILTWPMSSNYPERLNSWPQYAYYQLTAMA